MKFVWMIFPLILLFSLIPSSWAQQENLDQVMSDDEIKSIQNCEIGIYERVFSDNGISNGVFSEGEYYWNIIQKNKDSCTLEGFLKLDDVRYSFDCELPLDYLMTFKIQDGTIYPNFSSPITYVENCQLSEIDESRFSSYTMSKMTDEELIDKFQDLLNIKTREDFFTIFPSNIESEYISIELTKTQLRIEDVLNQRGWELLSTKAIHENGSEIFFNNISEPQEFRGTVFRSIDKELRSLMVEDLVYEYDSLIEKFDKLGINSEELNVTQELIDEINSDLYRFENIVVLLQHHGYDGMSVVDIVDGEVVGTVSYFEKYTLEPLFERQIPSGTINTFGTMGLIKESNMYGVPLSYDEQVTLIQSSSGLIGTIATFSDSSDPNNEIAGGMVLASIASYHPSVDNLKDSESELLSSEETPSLKIQEKSGVAPLDIVCKEGLERIFKYDDTPACVKPQTTEKLIERGWKIHVN